MVAWESGIAAGRSARRAVLGHDRPPMVGLPGGPGLGPGGAPLLRLAPELRSVREAGHWVVAALDAHHDALVRVHRAASGASREPSLQGTNGILRHPLGQHPSLDAGPQFGQVRAHVFQPVGGRIQQGRSKPAREPQPDYDARAVRVPAGAGIGSGDEEPAAVPDQVHGAVRENARGDRRRQRVAPPQRHTGHDRGELSVAHPSVMATVDRVSEPPARGTWCGRRRG
jgi:hypothetical protein